MSYTIQNLRKTFISIQVDRTIILTKLQVLPQYHVPKLKLQILKISHPSSSHLSISSSTETNSNNSLRTYRNHKETVKVFKSVLAKTKCRLHFLLRLLEPWNSKIRTLQVRVLHPQISSQVNVNSSSIVIQTKFLCNSTSNTPCSRCSPVLSL